VSGFFPDPCTGDDLIFRELLVTVWNRILLRLKDAKLSEKELEEVGFMLRRVWFTAQAYKAKKQSQTLEGWLALLRGTAKEAGISLG
jgi:hypothetical protein